MVNVANAAIYTANDERDIAVCANNSTQNLEAPAVAAMELRCWDNSFDGTDGFSIYMRLTKDLLSTTPDFGGATQVSACTLTFMGEFITLYEDAGAPVTGSIAISPASYWSYDGVWDSSTGAQLITPVPLGL